MNQAKGVSLMVTTQRWASTLSADRMVPHAWSDDTTEVRALKNRVLKTQPYPFRAYTHSYIGRETGTPEIAPGLIGMGGQFPKRHAHNLGR